MKSFAVGVLFLLLSSTPYLSANPQTPANTRAVEECGKLPLSFVENRGQVDEQVKFVIYGAQGSAFFTKDDVVFSLKEVERSELARELFPLGGADAAHTVGAGLLLARKNPATERFTRELKRDLVLPLKTEKAVALRASFVDPNPDLTVEGWGELPGKVNYFIGNDSSRWKTDIPTYNGVAYLNVWPGIDVIYRGEGKRLKYDIHVSPKSDIRQIKLRYDGAESISLTESGDLVISSTVSSFEERKPGIYQEKDGEKVWLDGGFTIEGSTVGFEITDYDPFLPLVIDPASDLAWSTFLGGTDGDSATGIALDSSGCAYVSGRTRSSGFPTTPGSFDTTLDQASDAFVAKLSADGSTLIYSTFLGGRADESEDGIIVLAVDDGGCAYVAGQTGSCDFPTTPGAFDPTFNGAWDAFVAKLNPSGSGLDYSTFLGGSHEDWIMGIAVDSLGCAYVSGTTRSPDFPTTPGAFDTTHNGEYWGDHDGFVTKLSADGSALSCSTLLGSTGDDHATGVAVDSTDYCAYVVGETQSSGFPTTAGAFDTSYDGSADGFLSKLSEDGSALVYSTFLGGNGWDTAHGITLDSMKSAYVVGQTGSGDFPTTAGAFDVTQNGLLDVFIAKLNPAGSELIYSTYLGGTQDEGAYAIVADAGGCAHVVGETGSSDFPTTPEAFNPTYVGNGDTIITKLNPTGSALVYSTFFGGTGLDISGRMAVDSFGSAYVAGWTTSSDLPATPGAFDVTYNGGWDDAFVAKLLLSDSSSPTVTITSPTDGPAYWTSNPTLDISGIASDDWGVTSVTWSNSRGGTGSCTGTTSWSATGIALYTGENIITVTARDAAENTGSDTLIVTLQPLETSAWQVAMQADDVIGGYSPKVYMGACATCDIIIGPEDGVWQPPAYPYTMLLAVLRDGTLLSRDLISTTLTYPPGVNAWELRAAVLPTSTANVIRLSFYTAGSTLLPPSTVDGMSLRYRLTMVDNRGRPGAPPNGTAWELPIPTEHSSVESFYIVPDLLPRVMVSAPTAMALMTEGYALRFEQIAGFATVSQAKAMGDGVNVTLFGKPVAATFGEAVLYIEESDRSCGIRVEKAGHGLSEGMRADVSGVIKTDADGQRYIEATTAAETGTGSVEPAGMTNRDIGGKDWLYEPLTGAGQKGIAGAPGLNNISLLIRTWGKVTYADTDDFYLDDGSELDDGSGHLGVKVLATGLSIPAQDSYVQVSGICSCFKQGDDLYRLIRVRDQADIVVLE